MNSIIAAKFRLVVCYFLIKFYPIWRNPFKNDISVTVKVTSVRISWNRRYGELSKEKFDKLPQIKRVLSWLNVPMKARTYISFTRYGLGLESRCRCIPILDDMNPKSKFFKISGNSTTILGVMSYLSVKCFISSY